MQHLDLKALDAAVPLGTAMVTMDALESYVIYWARHPKPGSFFAKLTRFSRWLPDNAYLWTLRNRRYGGNVLFKDGEAVAHGFYQRHGAEMHLFSVEVREDHRGQGYANRIMESFLTEMHRRPGIEWVRISAGGDEAMLHMWHKTLLGGYNVPCQFERSVRLGLGWARIVR